MRWLIAAGLAVVLLVLGAGDPRVMAESENDLATKAIARLEAAGQWLVAEGIAAHQAQGPEELKSTLIDSFAVNLWVTPVVDKAGMLADFRIKARGIGFDVRLIQQAQGRDGVVYEQWVALLSAEEWAASGAPGCRFYLARQENGAFGRRSILAKAAQYDGAFGSGAPVVFPVVDPKVLYRLSAWDYPNCYKGSAVPLDRVRPDGKGGYITGEAAQLPRLFEFAAQKNRAGVVEQLQAGADVNARVFNNGSALLAAAMVEDWGSVQLLLQAGADAMAADSFGITVPWLSSQDRPPEGSVAEAELNGVRRFLNDRLLLERVYSPLEVQAMLKNGHWPPTA